MNVVSISKEVDAEAVSILEDILAKAKRGEIYDVVVVAAINDDGGSGFYRSASFQDRWRILSAIEYAKDGVNRG